MNHLVNDSICIMPLWYCFKIETNDKYFWKQFKIKNDVQNFKNNYDKGVKLKKKINNLNNIKRLEQL